MKNKIGVNIPTILMPEKNADIKKWAVIACDQYTSEPEYWEEVEKQVGESYSTLRLTLPEVYLEEEATVEGRIKSIQNNMNQYLSNNVLVPQKPGFIYVERKTQHPVTRKGLIIAIDLEEYDYNLGSQSLVRPTEKTVIERIPPRVKIRENAPIEFPHIMLLIDDPNEVIIEPISKMRNELEKIYDFDLMMGGGHIEGYMINEENMLSDLIAKFEKLADSKVFNEKYNLESDKPILLFAVGDGNHSLASAKAHWENVKKTLSGDMLLNHPARFALVEVVNIHDKSLEIEPIHRVLFNVEPQAVLDAFKEYFNYPNCKVNIEMHEKVEGFSAGVPKLHENTNVQEFTFVTKDSYGTATLTDAKLNLTVGNLQAFLDDYLKNNLKAKIDYIHGEDVVNKLSSKENNMGLLLPPITKNELFKTIILDGVLPRKTFSMGEAHEKRYYIEGRKIVL